MGLAAPKNKIKLSHDPNNTRWTNDTSSFGHKIMTSQGWQPGQYLGAKDAAHAEFHTAANASHIRVSIKDDNLGLGAKIGSGVGHGECTGLDAFKNLLGRLNGKDEDEIAKEQKSRDDLRVAIYSERKWGSTRFVSGGFLIGDKIQLLIDAEAERIRKLALGASSDSSSSSESESASEDEEEPAEKPKKSKKRKIEALEEPEVGAVKVKKSKSKKDRKPDVAEISKDGAESSEAKVPKKSKKDRKSKSETDDTPDEAELKRRRKQEKKEKKERKEKAKAEADTTEAEPKKKKKSKKDKHKEVEDSSESSLPVTKESTPAVTESSGRSTPIMMQGRHAVRARNIAQKRMASMDAASLNQIFMIKSQ